MDSAVQRRPPYQQSIAGGSLGGNVSVPIPSRPPGFRIGSPAAPVQIELFIDLQCPASAKAFPTALRVQAQHAEDVAVTFLPLVLPAHRQAFHMLRSSLCAASSASASRSPAPASASATQRSFPSTEPLAATWVSYAAFLYAQVDRFRHSHYHNKTEDDLVAHLARCVLEFYHDEEERYDAYYQTIDSDALDQWAKESCRIAGKRVAVTPTAAAAAAPRLPPFAV